MTSINSPTGLAGEPSSSHTHFLQCSLCLAFNLLEAGHTNSQAKAITGHSTDQMVNHYAQKVNQKRQARAVMDKVVQFDKAASENG